MGLKNIKPLYTCGEGCLLMQIKAAPNFHGLFKHRCMRQA